MNETGIPAQIVMLSPARARVSWILDAIIVDKRLETAEHSLLTNIKINGFRPGRAPRNVLWRHHCKDIQQAFINAVVPGLWESLFAGGPAQYPFLPVDRPRFERLNPQRGKELKITAEVDVLPRLGLARSDYFGIDIQLPALEEADDAAVMAVIEERRHYWVTFKQAPEGHPAASGDYLLVKWRERVAGVNDWQEPLQMAVYLHDANSNRIPGFDDQLLGARMGDKFNFMVAAPDGTAIEIEILGIDDHKLRILPSAAEVAEYEGCADFEALKAKVCAALDTEARARHAAAMRQAVMAKLVSPALPVPPRLIEEKYLAVEHQAQLRALKAGMRHDDSPEHKAELRRVAVRLVQEDIALDEIVRLEAIEVGEDVIQAEIDRMAAEQNEAPEEILARLKRLDSLGGLQHSLAQRRALELVIDNAKKTEEVLI